MKRVDDLEFRWSDLNAKYELVQWHFDGVRETCIVIAFFDKVNEGCDIRFVGKRPFNVTENQTLWALLKYGQTIVDAEALLMHEVGIN